jgi:hypothetical protein
VAFDEVGVPGEVTLEAALDGATSRLLSESERREFRRMGLRLVRKYG